MECTRKSGRVRESDARDMFSVSLEIDSRERATFFALQLRGARGATRCTGAGRGKGGANSCVYQLSISGLSKADFASQKRNTFFPLFISPLFPDFPVGSVPFGDCHYI